MGTDDRRRALPLWFTGGLPLLLLAGLVAVFYWMGPIGVFRAAFPPIEELTIERFELRPGEVRVHVVNGGPDAVTVAQVMVDEAYWEHQMTPGRTIPRLGRATVTLPYPWVEGEAHEVTLISSTGVTFTGEIEVASRTPVADWRYLSTFTLLGVYVGVVPVFLGLLWFPFLQRLPEKWINFFLSLTIGLLIFLGVDTLAEAFETVERVPEAFGGPGLITVGFLGSLLGVTAFGKALGARRHAAADKPLVVAFLIALGIGLHNLGEGLAIGSAYSVGEIALGTFLVIGFALHNTTEGLAIVAPVARSRPGLGHLAFLGAVAGVPTIAGAWIGGFSYSPIVAILFLSIGAGAIFQVVYTIGRQMVEEAQAAVTAGWNFVGLILGLLIMYGTALLVVA